jgi:hypothetical protein
MVMELLVHEIVGRPPRVHREAEEAFERQARGRGEAGRASSSYPANGYRL